MPSCLIIQQFLDDYFRMTWFPSLSHFNLKFDFGKEMHFYGDFSEKIQIILIACYDNSIKDFKK